MSPVNEEIITRRNPVWQVWLRRRPTPVLTLRADGIQLEGRDLIPWADLESIGAFRTLYGHGLGIRLADPLGWYAAHTGPWRDVFSVMTMGRSPAQTVDMLGLRDPAQAVPPDRGARVEWARNQTGGWDLTIPDTVIAGGAEAALARIEDFRRRNGPMSELVVLADAAGNRLGTMAKSAVHHGDTPLHLAFSCYVFDAAGRLLVTRRAPDKSTFAALETNSVCGHPGPDEDLPDAVARRAAHELGLALADVRLVLPHYAYRAEFRGVVEHELCPVFAAFVADGAPLTLDRTEVDRAAWEPWEDFRAAVLGGARDVSPWCREQVGLLAALGADPAAWPVAALDELAPAFRP